MKQPLSQSQYHFSKIGQDFKMCVETEKNKRTDRLQNTILSGICSNQILTKVLRNGQEKKRLLFICVGGKCIYMQKTETRFLSSVIKSTYLHMDSHIRSETIKIWRSALGY